MRLRSLYLKNIRSYVNQIIEFPEGSIMLSGDVGAGKTTILLAIEFALFGVRKPDLTGSSLLRKSAQEGIVRLEFYIEKTKIIIERRLKKGKDIKQESGFIIIDGIKTEATPVELKSRIISLLGYPKDLLSKHKDLIFRYTVYTPQEEMKAILFEDKEARKNTIRRVFGIDKYRIIRENCQVYMKRLREKKANIVGAISGTADKEKQKSELETAQIELTNELKKVTPESVRIQEDIDSTKKQLVEYESKLTVVRETIKKQAVLSEKLDAQLKRYSDLKKESEKLRKDLETISIKSIVRPDIESLKTKKQKIVLELDSLKSDLDKALLRIEDSKKAADRIKKLEKCPTCEQMVISEHKDLIAAREKGIIDKYESKLSDLNSKTKKHSENLIHTESEIEKAHQLEKEFVLAEAQKKQLLVQKDRLKSIDLRKKEIKVVIGKINQERRQHIDSDQSVLTEKLEKIKQLYEQQLEDEKEIIIRKTGLEHDIEAKQKFLLEVDKELELLGIEKKRLAKIISFHDWLEKHFMNLIVVMEKHVMSQLYLGFNESFSDWFRILIADETMSVRLDEEFTPVVEQNGYDTELHSLSGGERTSIALSYRLALNKVINDFVVKLNTKDLIILDEPTDGFSSQQLDRVRDLLDAANFGQVILVSHESKIESYVDHVLRIKKDDQVSQVSS